LGSSEKGPSLWGSDTLFSKKAKVFFGAWGVVPDHMEKMIGVGMEIWSDQSIASYLFYIDYQKK
jgi:hypothetical protein